MTAFLLASLTLTVLSGGDPPPSPSWSCSPAGYPWNYETICDPTEIVTYRSYTNDSGSPKTIPVQTDTVHKQRDVVQITSPTGWMVPSPGPAWTSEFALITDSETEADSFTTGGTDEDPLPAGKTKYYKAVYAFTEKKCTFTKTNTPDQFNKVSRLRTWWVKSYEETYIP